MGRSYSLDLRERVVEAAAATFRRQADAWFGVGVATSIRGMTALTTTGTVAARPQGRARRSKLDPHEAFLRGLIDEKAGMTLEEMRARLRDVARSGNALPARAGVELPGPRRNDEQVLCRSTARLPLSAVSPPASSGPRRRPSPPCSTPAQPATLTHPIRMDACRSCQQRHPPGDHDRGSVLPPRGLQSHRHSPRKACSQ